MCGGGEGVETESKKAKRWRGKTANQASRTLHRPGPGLQFLCWCAPTQTASSRQLHLYPFLVFHDSGLPVSSCPHPWGATVCPSCPHGPNPALHVDLLLDRLPSVLLHQSCYLWKDAPGQPLMDLVGFLPPTRCCPGDRTNELALLRTSRSAVTLVRTEWVCGRFQEEFHISNDRL